MPRWKALPEDLDPQMRELTVRLRQLADRGGLSTATLADRTGYGRTSWERYLGGRLLAPKGAVIALAEATGTDPGPLTTLWERAERSWSRAESDDDHMIQAINVTESRAALGALAGPPREAGRVPTGATGGARGPAGGAAGRTSVGAADRKGGEKGAGPRAGEGGGLAAALGIAGPAGVSPTIPAQPTNSDADIRDGAPNGTGTGGDSGTGSGGDSGTGTRTGDGSVAARVSGRGAAAGGDSGTGSGGDSGSGSGTGTGTGDGSVAARVSGRGAAAGGDSGTGSGGDSGSGSGTGTGTGDGSVAARVSGRGAAAGGDSGTGSGGDSGSGSGTGTGDGSVAARVSGRGAAAGGGSGTGSGGDSGSGTGTGDGSVAARVSGRGAAAGGDSGSAGGRKSGAASRADSRTAVGDDDAPVKNSWGLAGYRGPSKASVRPGTRPGPSGPARTPASSAPSPHTPAGTARTPDVPAGAPGGSARFPDAPGGAPGTSAWPRGLTVGTPVASPRTPGVPAEAPTTALARTPGPPGTAPGAPAGRGPGRWSAHRQQVVMFLAGLVGVGALIAGVFLLTHRGGDGNPNAGATTSPSPSARPRTSPPPGVKCAGAACTGKDAEAMGCSGDLVSTAKTATVGTTTLEVRYSKACGTAWGRITSGAPGDTVRVTVGEVRQTGDITAAGDTIGYTPMIAVRDPAQARACATLASGETGCTG
ncbi:XRE family transcriptional regulator [Streptomyces flaveolus]|uniref:XRE family transcriptional regulator n=1 Tax=Streptomyces flaveolus TaxID=67297 RepID=UPI0033C25F3F